MTETTITSRVRRFFQRWGRTLLLVVGAGAVVWLVHMVGPRAVWANIVAAGPYLPLIFFLDLAWAATEGIALLVLFGKDSRKIPVRDWVEATLAHFTTMMVLPVGRAGAEVARATMLSKHVGATRATAGAALMQSMTLMANALVTTICMTVVLRATTEVELGWLLFANGAATGVAGTGLYLVMRRARLGGWLGSKFEKMATWGPELDGHFRESRSRHPLALACALLGRSVQTLQYGVILLAVTGSFSAVGMFIAQGIHLIGAGFGDFVPNQVGVTEGAYRIFAGALDLADVPEKAVAVALLARVSNVTVAGLCALGVRFLPSSPASRVEPPSTPVDDAVGAGQ